MSSRMEKIISIETFADNTSTQSFDTLITACSYEERIIKSFERSIKFFDIKKAILLVYDGHKYLDTPTMSKWRINRKEMQQMFISSGITMREISCVHDDVTKVSQDLKTINASKNVLIDITGLTKNYILKLAKMFDSPNTYFLYTRSKTDRVPTSQEMAVSINRIEPLDGFEGYVSINKNDLVVLILGYEGNRSLAFLNKFETEPTLAIIGSPYVEDEEVNRRYIQSAIEANRQLLNIHRVHRYEKPVRSLNPFLFVEDLEAAIDSFPYKKKCNICLSCLGTKLQTLGLYLYWKRNNQCQILYSVPNKRFDISSGAGKSWIIRLPYE